MVKKALSEGVKKPKLPPSVEENAEEEEEDGEDDGDDNWGSGLLDCADDTVSHLYQVHVSVTIWLVAFLPLV